MRSIKLIAAVAAAATLLTVAAVAASARPRAHGHARSRPAHVVAPKGCRINLFVEPHTITSGESAQLFGQLHCPGGSNAGQTVTVYGSSAGSPTPTVVGTPTTGAGGFYSLVQSGLTTDSFFYASALGVRSDTKVVKVSPLVTLNGPSEKLTLFTGVRSRVTFTGTVSPADAGAELALQRENATSTEEWHRIQLGTVGFGGVYSITHTFAIPGDANIRIVVRRHGKFTVRGISNTLSYGISQKENPLLTINTKSYSVPYGSPVTLTGVLASGAGKTVTLQGRTAGGEFKTLATTTATPEYSFTGTPLANTVFRVTGNGLKSATLFEGIKYVLTAGISGKTVQSGQPLTFTGTVTPGTVGKTVYLERENAFGGGFHDVDTGSVLAGGSYSITHYFFGSGKQVYRVRAPGDPTNQAASSATFTVEVTPAPPASLKPVLAPKVPSEGTF